MSRDSRGTAGAGGATAAWWIALAAIVAVAAATQWWTQSRLGPVNDELANFPSGVALVRTGQQADPTHPPLARYLMAIPLLAAGVDPHADHPSLGTDWHLYGRDFLFHNTLPWRSILDLARLPILLLCLAMVVVVAREARRRWGATAGLAAAAALAFEPSILGHGTLATTDLGLTVAVFVSVLAFDRFLRAPSGPRLLGVAAAVTVATLTKFAGILLVPLLGVTAVAAWLAAGRHLPGPWPRIRWWAFAVGLSAMLAWAAYGFEVRSMSQDPQLTSTREAAKIRDGIGQVSARIGMTADELMAVPIPAYSLVKGFGAQMFHAARQDAWEDKDFYQYLDGEYDRSGFRTYYLHTFLYKSTLPSLVLWAWAALAGAWAIARRRRAKAGTPGDAGTTGTRVDARTTDAQADAGATDAQAGAASWAVLALPPLLWVAACSFQTINIGHRYVLPAIPFLSLGVGWLVGRSWDAAAGLGRRPGTSGRHRALVAASASAAVALLAAHAATGITAAPNHIAFFNAIAGGIDNGSRHLVDSNIDWGQDLPALDEDARLRCTGGHACIAAVFGTARPEDYGTPVQPWVEPADPSKGPGPTTFYVSENRYRLRSLAHPDGLFPFLRDRVPVRRVGASIRVYEFP